MAKNSDSVAHFFGGADPGLDEPVNLSLENDEDTDESSGSADGEIAVDVFQTDSHVVIVSPIAGVRPEDIEIAATDDTITISGERATEHSTRDHDVVMQEIYWGAFQRSISLPVPCMVDKATAAVKHGVLTVKVPKASKAKKHVIKVKPSE